MTHINTDKNGNENLFIQKPDDYDNTGVDYEPGKDYTFTLSRDGDQVRWVIEEEGQSSPIYAYQGQGNDFKRLVLEAWTEWSESSSDPSMEIKKVEITEN